MRSTAYIDTPISKPSKLSIRQQVKKDREKNINLMSRHAVWLSMYKRDENTILYLVVFILFGLICAHTAGLL